MKHPRTPILFLLCLILVGLQACDDGDPSDPVLVDDADVDGAPSDASIRLDGFVLPDTGATVGPEIDVNPRSTQMLAEEGGQARQVVTIRNQGTSPLIVSAISFETEDPAFALEDAESFELAPEMAREFTLVFTPQTPQMRRVTVLIASDDETEPTVRLSVSGRLKRDCVGASPPGIDFGAIEGGATSGRNRLAIDNCGDIPITLESASVEGMTGVTVTLENNEDPVGEVIAPSAILPLSVTFINESLAPGDVAEGTLVLATNSAETPEIRITLKAEGGMAMGCIAAFQPGAINFGALRVGLIAHQEVQISNIGGGACEIRELSVGRLRGSTPFPLRITRGLEVDMLAPESSVTIEVEYAPLTANGTGEIGELRLDYHDPEAGRNRRATAQLAATSAEAVIGRPDDGADLGDVMVGCGSWARNANIENASAVPLCVTAIGLRGADCLDFRITELPEIGDCLQLDPFETLSVPVIFQPGEVSSRACSVVFTSDADNRQDMPVPLVGEGVETADSNTRHVVGRLNAAFQAHFDLDRPAVEDSISVTIDGEPTENFGFNERRNTVFFDVGQHPERGDELRIAYQAVCYDLVE